MVINVEKPPYRIFNLRIKDKIKEEASSGCYNKWKLKVEQAGSKKYIWIKSGSLFIENYMHESIMEVVTSNLAKDLGIKDVVQYYPCVLNIEELNGTITRSIGCYSWQFTEEDEKVVSFEDLGIGSRHYGNTIKAVASITKIREEDIRNYIDKCLLIDSLVLNIDRHSGNLAVIKNGLTGKYRLCPVFDFGLGINGLMTAPTEIEDFDECRLVDSFRAKPFSVFHDSQLKLTHFKENIDGKIELLHMFKDTNINNTMTCIDKMFACFGYDYLNNWSDEQRKKADRYRSLYGIELPMLLGERHYLISVIKRRMEVVLGDMPYRMRLDTIEKETEVLIDYMSYKKGCGE